MSLVAAATTSLPSRDAHAQASHRLSPVGGRTTLVGGTGLVYGHDSASAFLNPATVVRVDSNRLAFSVDFYYLSLNKAGDWYRPGAVDTNRFGDVPASGSSSVTAIDFDSLPGSLCVFFRIGDIPFLKGEAKKELRERQARLGVCLASIQYHAFAFNDESYSQQTDKGLSRQAQNIRQTFRRLAVGPSYAMYVTNALAVGASVHFRRSSHRSLFGSTAVTYGPPTGPISSSFYEFSRGDSHDLALSLGAFYRIGSHQTVALAFEAPSIHLFGSGGVNFQNQWAGAGSSSSIVAASGPFTARSPMRIGLGTGIEQTWGSAEMNVSFSPGQSAAYSAEYEGRSFTVAPDGTTADQVRKLNLSTRALGSVNFGVGGEVFLSPRISLLGGLSTTASVAPKGALKADPLNFFPERTHRVGLSFGVGSHGEGGDLLIGSELSYGWGDRLTPNAYQLPTQLDVTGQQQFGFLFVLAGSTSFRNIKRAVENITNPTKAPDPPPKTGPATKFETPAPENKTPIAPAPNEGQPQKALPIPSGGKTPEPPPDPKGAPVDAPKKPNSNKP